MKATYPTMEELLRKTGFIDEWEARGEARGEARAEARAEARGAQRLAELIRSGKSVDEALNLFNKGTQPSGSATR
jgi:hypothetical protein